MNQEAIAQENPKKSSAKSSIAVTDGSERELEPNFCPNDENAPNSEKLLQVENTEDVIKFSHLLFEVNRLLRYTSIIRSETKFLAKIQNILTFNDTMNAKLLESLLQGTPTFQRVKTKVSYLKNIYEYFSNHRAFLLDYTIMYLGAILHHMKILKNLDYRRVLYVKNQVSKCKTIVMNCIREGCPNVCNKYKEAKYQSLLQEINAELPEDDDEETQEKIIKKVKTT